MFQVQNTVEWSKLRKVLSEKFCKDVGTYLRMEHLDFLYRMIPEKTNTTTISWEQFAKISLPMRNFTFFEWFYKTLVLVREQLSLMYCDELIHGFISSDLAEKLLQNCVDGTFLIRFSETICGAISITYKNNGEIYKSIPWELDKLKNIHLSNTIKNTNKWQYLYPNKPKNEAFHSYYIYNSARSVTGRDYSDPPEDNEDLSMPS